MKRFYYTTAAVLLVGSAAVAAVTSLTAQTPEVPTDHHKMIQSSVGTWEGTVTMYFPGAEGQEAPAKEVITAHGPFWTKSEFSMPMGPGMQYQGHGLQGYNAKTGKFMGTWIGSTDSHLMIMEGTYDEKTKTMTMTYEAPNMMTGELTPHRNVTVHGDNTYTMTFFEKDNKTMSITMNRTAKAVEASHGADGHSHDGDGHDKDGKHK